MSACEGLWAYHTVQENHRFRSADCSSNIFRSCYNMPNFHCSRTKCEAIIKNVLAPYSEDILIAEISKTRFITLLSDASNHKNVKMMPVLARYFIPTIGVCVKLLDFTAQQGETSDIIFRLLLKTSNDYNIRQKIVGFSADNTNTNFGGSARGGTNNVFYKMKNEFPNIVGVGCAAHIVHNAIKSACSSIPFDVENIAVKIYSHFYIYTVRVESLKEFCEQTDEEFKEVLGYSKSRFLTLSPAIRRILQLFNALKSYFAQVRNENVIKRFFEDPFAKLWLLFLSEQVSETRFSFYPKFHLLFDSSSTHNFIYFFIYFVFLIQAKIFHDIILRIESDNISAVEVGIILDDLKSLLQTRKNNEFLMPSTEAEKNQLVEDGKDIQPILTSFNKFHGEFDIFINVIESIYFNFSIHA